MKHLEVWREIKGYEGLYSVSSFGNVKSISRIIYRTSKHGVKTSQAVPEKIKKGSIDKNGYIKVGLWKNNKQLTVSVHRLVAKAFLKNPLKLPQINHIDEVKSNNNINNLEWCTSFHNVNHGSGIQRGVDARVKKINQYLLSGKFIKTWSGVPEIAKFYNISDKSIYNILKKKNRQSHGFMWKINKNNSFDIDPYKHIKTYPVYQYTRDKILIKTYNSIREASDSTGVNRSNITHCLNGTKKYSVAGGYLWSKIKIKENGYSLDRLTN